MTDNMQAPGSTCNRYREIIERQLARQNNLGARDRRDVYLGLDLGTSYTKVVWRHGQFARPVCFGQRRDRLDDYLVPSIVYFDGERFQTSLEWLEDPALGSECAIPNFKICLTCEGNRAGECRGLKCPISNWNAEIFPEETRNNEAGLVTSVFLASILSRSKHLILNELERSTGHGQKGKVRWSVNLAVPDKYLDGSNAAHSFEIALKAAWLMSLAMDEVTGMHTAREIIGCYTAARCLAEENSLDCFVYSEVAAEVASVTLSRTSQDGLYAFVDIGAGTVDASVFRFYTSPQGDRTHNKYAAEVLPIGSAYIETLAMRWFDESEWFISEETINGNNGKKAAETRLRACLREMKENGGSRPDTYCLIEAENLNRALCEASRLIRKRVYRELVHLFGDAYGKEKKHSRWLDLRLILGGGGAGSPVYRKAAIAAFTLKNNPSKKPELIELPKPGDFQMNELDRKHFHRFAVAYGLSHRPVDLLQVVQPSQIAPLTVNATPISISAPSKDEC